ncbi:hypothetical protein C356_05201 [Cryptococcus neoformans c45]|nr:hypothetical protein C356_05201 [Cryptococcus neoformans var. grubii c45]
MAILDIIRKEWSQAFPPSKPSQFTNALNWQLPSGSIHLVRAIGVDVVRGTSSQGEILNCGAMILVGCWQSADGDGRSDKGANVREEGERNLGEGEYQEWGEEEGEEANDGLADWKSIPLF